MIDPIVQQEIEAFLRAKAPGLALSVHDNPAFDSITLTLSVEILNKQLISNRLPTTEIGAKVIEMLAEVQKAAVTAIGMEEYVRERELAVLDRLQERIAREIGEAGLSTIGFDSAREELGGKPGS